MSLAQNIDRAASLMHTLTTAEVIDNTFGLVSNLNQVLQQILRELPSASSGGLDAEAQSRLRELARIIQGNRLVFGIPEKWLVDNVVHSATRILQRLEA